MNDPNLTILMSALQYHKNGWSIFPASSKQPAIQSWEQYQATAANEDQIKSWFSNTNKYNIALVTGKVSGLLAFDVDGEAAAAHFHQVVEFIEDNEIVKAIANTMRTKTGSGNLHIVIGFKPEEFSNGDLIGNPLLWRSKIDTHHEIRLKGEGGYIIAPPSTHPNGNRYEFINDSYPVILSKEQIIKLLSMFKRQQEPKANVRQVEKCGLDDNAIANIVSDLVPYYKEGIRNYFVMYLSGWLRKETISFESAKKIIEQIAKDDEEKNNRLRTLEKTYHLEDLAEIKGYSGMLYLLTSIIRNEDEARQILSSVKLLFPNYKNETGKGTNGKKAFSSEAELILFLAHRNCTEFFTDQYAIPYASVRINGHIETLNMNSTKIRYWLYRLYYKNYNTIPNSESVTNALHMFRSEVAFSENKKVLYLRVGRSNDRLKWCYDLTNDNCECIEATLDGWEIAKDVILFKRYSNQIPQVYPDKQYDANVFDRFMNLLNVKDPQTRLLLKCYIISLFVPDIPKPILILYGEQGSAKTTLQELIKMLIDPSRIKTLTFPRDINELVQKLDHNFICYFDNVSHIKEWTSDELCRAVTGGGFSKRQLYTDDDDIIYSFVRCIGLNGINLAATKADLLDRSLIIQLERIERSKRRKLEDVREEFEAIKPQLLGYIFDILVKVLQFKRDKKKVELVTLPRMADFAEYGEIISRCMGNTENTFLDTYYKNINLQTEEVLESSPIATTLVHFMASKTVWKGTASNLLSELEKIAVSLKINIRSRSWPKQPNYLSRRLAEIRSNLREVGIMIEWISDSTRNTRIIEIRKVLKQDSDNGTGQSPNTEVGLEIINNTSPHQLEKEENYASKIEVRDSEYNRESFITPAVSNAEVANSTDSSVTTNATGQKQQLFKNNYVALDLEWYTGDGQRQIYAAAFVDNVGNGKVLHISDFNNSESDLLNAVNKELTRYPMSLGWTTTGIEVYKKGKSIGVDSDLVVLNERCVKHGIESIIRFKEKGIPHIEAQTHIDLYKVFQNEMIRTSIFKNKYRSAGLDDVSKALLGKGKIEDITGENVWSKSKEEQKRYVQRDAELVMDLSKINNGEILELMNSIAGLIGLTFEEVCRSTISTWWSKVFENMGFVASSYSENIIQEYQYEGGTVIEPKKGVYRDLKLVDVVSLYPSMAIQYNISFDTINCECCSSRLDARVSVEVLDKGYWICKQKEGAFPNKLKEFKAERIKAKREGNEVKQQGLKILINGGYGLFGNPGFKFADIRVAELITAYGRYTLKRMQGIAESNGFIVVAGDTDSLFLYIAGEADISKFIHECKEELNVDVEHYKTFKRAIIIKKKHYLGITDKGDIVIKGMEGIKNDRPPWINYVFNQFVKDLLANNHDPLTNLRKSIQELEEAKVDNNELKISIKLSKDPDQYTTNTPQKKIGLILNAKAGDVIQYYLSHNTDGVSLNPDDISIKKYKNRLWNAVKDCLQIIGHNIESIEQELFLETE